MPSRAEVIQMLRQVADVVMQVLALLLQSMMQLLNNPDVEPDQQEENMGEYASQFQAMMLEMQNQRQALQTLNHLLIEQQESSMPKTKTKETAAKKAAKTIASHKFWTVIEDEDSDELQQHDAAGSSTVTEKPAACTNRKTKTTPPTQPEMNMATVASPGDAPTEHDLAEWGPRIVSWGRKHNGRSYLVVYEMDPGYFSWLFHLAGRPSLKFGARAAQPVVLRPTERSPQKSATCLKPVTEEIIKENLNSMSETSLIVQSINILDNMFKEFCQNQEAFDPVMPAMPIDETQLALMNAKRIALQVHSEALPMTDPCSHQIDLLEVYADPNSPLTDAINRRGGRALRFTKQDGDLATSQGQNKLWSWMNKYQPKEVRVAPDCGPWGAWSRFNLNRSVEAFDRTHQLRETEMAHLDLCHQLCKYQVKCGRQFHMEHPKGSEAWTTPSGIEIQKHTQEVLLDMCAFGLKIPGTTKYLRKFTKIQTTSPEMWKRLHMNLCPTNHEHIPIAGSNLINGKSTKISRSCASYCQGFANKVASAVVPKTVHHQGQSQEAFVIREKPDRIDLDEEDEHVNKRARSSDAAEMPSESTRPISDVAPRSFKRLRMTATPAIGQEAIETQAIDRSNEPED